MHCAVGIVVKCPPRYLGGQGSNKGQIADESYHGILKMVPIASPLGTDNKEMDWVKSTSPAGLRFKYKINKYVKEKEKYPWCLW